MLTISEESKKIDKASRLILTTNTGHPIAMFTYKRDHIRLKPIDIELRFDRNYPVIVRPPFEVFVVIGVVYCVKEFVVDLWQAVGATEISGFE